MNQLIKKVSFILLGNLIVAFGIGTMVLDHNIISSGVTGLGIVLNHYFGWQIPFVVALLNIALFLLGYIFMGKQFALSTLVSTFSFPVFLDFFTRYDLFKGLCSSSLVASILGGMCIGIGVGIMIRFKASSGGGDIIAIILNDRFHIPVFIVLNLVDLSILLLQFPLRAPLEIFYGFITIFLTSLTLRQVLKLDLEPKSMAFTH